MIPLYLLKALTGTKKHLKLILKLLIIIHLYVHISVNIISDHSTKHIKRIENYKLYLYDIIINSHFSCFNDLCKNTMGICPLPYNYILIQFIEITRLFLYRKKWYTLNI